MNVVHLMGNLTRDPELKHVGSNNTAVVNFSLAINERVKRNNEWVDETHFVECVMWGARGEAFAKHHSKGDKALITGGLRMETWEDKESGAKRSKLKVKADQFEFVKGGKSDSSSGSLASADTPF